MHMPLRFARGIATLTFGATVVLIPIMPLAPASAAPATINTGGFKLR